MKKISLLLLPLLLLGCIKQPEKEFANNNLNSMLWMQTAAEYKANSIMIYQAATEKLENFINDKKHSALLEQQDGYEQLPPAIILDVDETVLDNSPYDAMLVKEDKIFSNDTWNNWISLKQAKAIPGVVNFLNTAQQKGVTIFYVTNRKCAAVENDPCPQDMQTFENLQNSGIENVLQENVMLRDEQEGWGRDKTSRRGYVAENYRVIMLFGDNLGDFLADTATTIETRAALINNNLQHWGYDWFMLANPAYGGWENVLKKPGEDNLEVY